MRPRILLDVDGPLTNGFVELVCEMLQEYGVNATPSAIGEWDIMKAFRVSDKVAASVFTRLRRPGVAYSFVPRKGAAEFVEKLQEWADVYAVTSPLGGHYWQHDRELWLDECVGIKPERVISVRDKSIISGHVLVDDKVETLDAWQRNNPWLALLWSAPHNISEPRYLRVSDFDTLYPVLEDVRAKVWGDKWGF